jgi:hypothetical protein
MWKAVPAITLGVALGGAVLAHTVFAQHSATSGGGQSHSHHSMPGHGAGMHAGHKQGMHGMPGSAPTMPGQDAFGAIAEIVRILEADPATDWSKVDMERLRQHLIDMHEVMLRAAVKQTSVPGGLAMEMTGTGRTEHAIRAMVVPHAIELDRMADWSAKTETLPDGIRMTVVAESPDNATVIARIRGLGFAGLMTQGAHHQPHHLAMARGEAFGGHTH